VSVSVAEATEVAAASMFDGQQAQRLDSTRINEATGRLFQWDELNEPDRVAYRVIVAPIVASVLSLVEQEGADRG